MAAARRNRKYVTYRRCGRDGCRHSFTRHMLDACAVAGCDCTSWAARVPHRWREFVVDAHNQAMIAWSADLEHHAMGYKYEMAEYRRDHPSPKFKDFLIHLRHGEDET